MKKIKEQTGEVEFNYSFSKKGYIRLRKTSDEIKSSPKWLKTFILQVVITLAFIVIRYIFPR